MAPLSPRSVSTTRRGCARRSSARAVTETPSPAEAPGNTDRIVTALAQGGLDAPEIGCSPARCAEFFGMDAAGDQQAVDPRSRRTGNVGAQTVADGKDARAILDPEKPQAGIVHRAKRLAVPANIAPRLLVRLGQAAGAQVESAAAHHDEIGVGAHHRQT